MESIVQGVLGLIEPVMRNWFCLILSVPIRPTVDYTCINVIETTPF